MTQLLKDAIILGAEVAGGGDLVAYLARQAKYGLSSAVCFARRRVPSVSDLRCLSEAALRMRSKRYS